MSSQLTILIPIYSWVMRGIISLFCANQVTNFNRVRSTYTNNAYFDWPLATCTLYLKLTSYQAHHSNNMKSLQILYQLITRLMASSCTVCLCSFQYQVIQSLALDVHMELIHSTATTFSSKKVALVHQIEHIMQYILYKIFLTIGLYFTIVGFRTGLQFFYRCRTIFEIPRSKPWSETLVGMVWEHGLYPIATATSLESTVSNVKLHVSFIQNKSLHALLIFKKLCNNVTLQFSCNKRKWMCYSLLFIYSKELFCVFSVYSN